jgi:hypothetical protein
MHQADGTSGAENQHRALLVGVLISRHVWTIRQTGILTLLVQDQFQPR